MKRTLIIELFMILFSFVSQAQGHYSIENLKQSSPQDLDMYLQKAHNLKKSGKVVTLIGTASILTGMVLVATDNETNAYIGIGMTVIGLGVTVVGIPIFISGSSRVKRINKIKNSVSDGLFFEIAPCSFQNHLAHNHQYGSTLRIRF